MLHIWLATPDIDQCEVDVNARYPTHPTLPYPPHNNSLYGYKAFLVSLKVAQVCRT